MTTFGTGFNQPKGLALKPSPIITQNPSHTFSSPSTYTVTMVAVNSNGGNTITKTIMLEEGSVTPAPEFPAVAFPVMVIGAVAVLAMAYRKVDNESP